MPAAPAGGARVAGPWPPPSYLRRFVGMDRIPGHGIPKMRRTGILEVPREALTENPPTAKAAEARLLCPARLTFVDSPHLVDLGVRRILRHSVRIPLHSGLMTWNKPVHWSWV